MRLSYLNQWLIFAASQVDAIHAQLLPSSKFRLFDDCYSLISVQKLVICLLKPIIVILRTNCNEHNDFSEFQYAIASGADCYLLVLTTHLSESAILKSVALVPRLQVLHQNYITDSK